MLSEYYNCYCASYIATLLTNGSTVLRTDIGEGDVALQCTTDRVGCCTGAGRAGEFYFPDCSVVQVVGNDLSRTYYRDRGDGFIRLNRRSNGTQTGLFCCEIPDASGMLVNLFINVGMLGHIKLILSFSSSPAPDFSARVGPHEYQMGGVWGRVLASRDQIEST